MVMVGIKDVAKLLRRDEASVYAEYAEKGVIRNLGFGDCVPLSILPVNAKKEYEASLSPRPNIDSVVVPAVDITPALDYDLSLRAEAYASAPNFNRKVADRRTMILGACEGLRGVELDEFVKNWNVAHPTDKVSVKAIYRWRAKRDGGVPDDFLGAYGKRRGDTVVPDALFDYFKRLYMTQGRPTQHSCYMTVIGYAIKLGYDHKELPRVGAFMRRIKNEIPEQALCTARFGPAAANKKYGFYIKRDYSKTLAGECWVSDHVQLDCVVECVVGGKKRAKYPWVTVIRDYKSGRWLGWHMHINAPNSDDIYMAFYRAVKATDNCVPSFFYVDNGNDYRSNDLTGGRKKFKVSVDDTKITSMCAALGIQVIFATPYNGQSKPLERDFLTNKLWHSMHNPGYRGGNVVERPENLKDKISAGHIYSFEEEEGLFDRHINEIAMKMPIMSKNSYRYGKSPLQIWNEEYAQSIERGLVRAVSDKAIAMFCCRASRVLSIGRTGVYDSECGVTYYDFWMEGQKGRKVILRRDPKAMEVAWVFDANTEELIDKADILRNADALARTGIEKRELAQLIALKKQSNKLHRILADQGDAVPLPEVIDNKAIYIKTLYPETEAEAENSAVSPIRLLTKMDVELGKYDNRKKAETPDLSPFGPMAIPEKAAGIYNFEWEREEALARTACAG